MDEQERLIAVLREHMPPQVQVAAIFGSMEAGGLVNLLLIAEGLSGLRAQALFAPLGRELGRHIEVHLCTAAEWANRLESGDGFVQGILTGPMVLILGELRREAENDSVAANLARMKNPVFGLVARALEQFVPKNAGFGRFRDHK